MTTFRLRPAPPPGGHVLDSVGMTLRLTGVRVLVPDGPGAAVAAELMREAGAEPVVVGFDAVPPAGHPGPPPGPDVAVGLVHVPAGTADGSA
ncbi:hypothetical protein CXF37_03950, partial [Corynebacterium bovis]